MVTRLVPRDYRTDCIPSPKGMVGLRLPENTKLPEILGDAPGAVGDPDLGMLLPPAPLLKKPFIIHIMPGLVVLGL